MTSYLIWASHLSFINLEAETYLKSYLTEINTTKRIALI
jgi:hypothetical protein